MLFHVGVHLSLNKNYFTAYEVQSKVTSFKIITKLQWKNPLISEEKINIKEVEQNVTKIFDNIRSRCPGELGCCCITLYAQDNTSRKMLIDFGIQYGFFKVEIIDAKTSFYLHSVFHSLFQPTENDLIFVFQERSCDIWKIMDGTAIFIIKIVEYWKKLKQFRQLMQDYANIDSSNHNSNVILNPKILFNSRFHTLFIKKFFCRYPIFEYQIENFGYSYKPILSKIWTYVRGPDLIEKKPVTEVIEHGAIIRARMMAADAAVLPYRIQSILDRDIVIRINDSTANVLFSCKMHEKLPLKICIKMIGSNNFNITKLKVHSKLFTFSHRISTDPNAFNFVEIVDESLSDSTSQRLETVIPVPDNKATLLTIDFDLNGIILHSFENLANFAILDIEDFIAKYYHVNLSQHLPQKSFINLTSNFMKHNITSFNTFQIPQFNNGAITSSNVVGVHFGSTRCCAAVIRPTGKIETVALDSKGERMLPAYVSFSQENDLCGQVVIDRLRNYAKYTVYDVKRVIGKHLSGIEIDETWPFKIVEENDRIKYAVQGKHGEINKYPEEVSAALFKKIKQTSEEFQGKTLPEVVITVPVEFNNEQNDAIYASALLAGWKSISLIPEPIAAIFAYFMERPIPSNSSSLLLFKLGGGTLEICIFKIENNAIKMCARNGNSKLGGRDFDKILVEYFIKKLDEEYNVQINATKRYTLMSECLKIKEDLSEQDELFLAVDNYDFSKDGYITVTRKEFELLTINLLHNIQQHVDKAVQQFQSKDIDRVLYIGGGSRMPMIKQLLNDMFPNAEHCCEPNLDELAGIGAAYYSQHLSSSQKRQSCSIM